MSISEQQKRPPSIKRTYQAPKLECFGYVRDLTAAGSAGAAESAKQGQTMCTPVYRGTQGSGC